MFQVSLCVDLVLSELNRDRIIEALNAKIMGHNMRHVFAGKMF